MGSFALDTIDKVVSASSTTGTFVPLGDWVPAGGVKEIKALLKILSVAGTNEISVRLAYQTAGTDTDEPDAYTTFGTAQAATGQYCSGLVDISTPLTWKYFVRFGVEVKTITVSEWRRADIRFTVSGRD